MLGLIVSSCSKKDEPERPPRPGQEPVEHPVASVRFDQSEMIVEVDRAPALGRLECTVVRTGSYLPDTSYALGVTDPAGVLTVPAYVHFPEGSASAPFSGHYKVSLEEGQEYAAELAVKAAPDSAAACMRVLFRHSSLWEDYGGGTYRTGNRLLSVNIRRRCSEGITEYELCGADGFRRIFAEHADGHISLAQQPAAIDGFDSATHSCDFGDDAFRARFPIYTVPSAYQPDNYCWLLNLTYLAKGEGAAPEPRCDIVRMERKADPRWEYAGEAQFCDGWLLQAISFEARPPLEPESNPWTVEMQRYRSDHNLLRAVGLYRVASPLSALNSEAELAVLPIVVDPRGGSARIEPSYSGFDSPGLFAAPFTIGGRGTYTRSEDGTSVIAIPVPLHNAYGTYGDTWATVHPATFVIY